MGFNTPSDCILLIFYQFFYLFVDHRAAYRFVVYCQQEVPSSVYRIIGCKVRNKIFYGKIFYIFYNYVCMRVYACGKTIKGSRVGVTIPPLAGVCTPAWGLFRPSALLAKLESLLLEQRKHRKRNGNTGKESAQTYTETDKRKGLHAALYRDKWHLFRRKVALILEKSGTYP